MTSDVLVAIPNGGQLSASCADSLMRAGLAPMLIPASVNSLSERRNDAVRTLLDSTSEWLLFVDSDMGFGPDAVTRLLSAADAAERPVMGALCFGLQQRDPDGMGGYVMKPFPTLFDFDGTSFNIRWDYPRDVVTRVDATGCAMLLIHRDVLAKFDDGTWFDRARLGAELLGEDISFCARAGERGIPIHVHTGVRTSHHKSLWLTEAHYISARIAAALVERTVSATPTNWRGADNVNKYRYKADAGLAARARIADPDLSDELPSEMHDLDMAPGTEVTVVGHDEERDLMLVGWTDLQGNPRTTSIEQDVFDADFEEC